MLGAAEVLAALWADWLGCAAVPMPFWSLLAGLLEDGVTALFAPTALLELAPVLVSLVCGGVLVEEADELGLVWLPAGAALGCAAVPVPAAGLFGFELVLIPAIG